MPTLGSGSDFAPFVTKEGVTSIDIKYEFVPSKFPLYHSVYETFHLVTTYYDPQFLVRERVVHYAHVYIIKLDDKA